MAYQKKTKTKKEEKKKEKRKGEENGIKMEGKN